MAARPRKQTLDSQQTPRAGGGWPTPLRGPGTPQGCGWNACSGVRSHPSLRDPDPGPLRGARPQGPLFPSPLQQGQHCWVSGSSRGRRPGAGMRVNPTQRLIPSCRRCWGHGHELRLQKLGVGLPSPQLLLREAPHHFSGHFPQEVRNLS